MRKQDCFFLGYIQKPFGLKGAVQVKLDTDEPHKYQKLESIFLEQSGNLVPFFIKSIQLRQNNIAILEFDHIKTIEQTNPICGCEIYLPLSALPPLTGKRFYYHEVEGYTVIDQEHGNIGQIDYVIDTLSTHVFRILKDKTEILMPINDQVIQSLDRENKIIHIIAPEGLIDLYLGL